LTFENLLITKKNIKETFFPGNEMFSGLS